MIPRFLCLLTACCFLHANAQAAPVIAPDRVIRDVSNQLILSIQKDRALTHNLKKMDEVVDTLLLPHFDFVRLTRLTVGGSRWHGATPDEQKEIIKQYRVFLAHTFADVIAQYTDQTVYIFPLNMHSDGTETIVRTAIMDPGDEPTELDYSMERAQSGWLIFDMSIDGIRVSKIYRSNFRGSLDGGGVENLISELQKKNAAVQYARERH